MDEPQIGAQSMIGPLRRALLVPPPRELDRRALDAAGWGVVRAAGLTEQYRRFRALLRDAGVDVVESAPAPADNPDAIYGYDGVLVTRAGSIAMRMAKANRRGEPDARVRDMEALGIPRLGAIEAPGTMDAGDTLWLDETRLAVGLGWRTNEAAVEQLRAIVAPLGVEIVTFDLPNHLGPAYCLHLMSLLSLVSERLAVARTPLLPVRLVRELERRGVELVDSPADEFDGLGTNLLALAPGRVVALANNTTTIARLRSRGVEVLELEAPDLALAGTGGPTCLTRPLSRGPLASP